METEQEKDEHRYFTFPVTLLQGAFEDVCEVCCNIITYCCYRIGIGMESSTNLGKMKAAAKYFEMEFSDPDQAYQNGLKIFQTTPDRTPMTSIKKELVLDFYKNNKNEFQIAVFLAFCSIRSILQTKPYCKAVDVYLLSRMNGNAKMCEDYLSHPILKKYSSRYFLNKLKEELINNWKMKYYAKKTRGFYVSFDLSLDELVLQVIKKQKKQLNEKHQNEVKEAIRKANEKLNGNMH